MLPIPPDFKLARKTYDSHLAELRPHKGQWVLIRRTEIVGLYADWETAIETADEKFPDGVFYIRQIETPISLEFDITPSPAKLEEAA